MSIISLKAEDKLEKICWKIKNIHKKFVILRCCDGWVSEFFFKVFSFKYWRNKFTAFFFQNIKKLTILIFSYLKANINWNVVLFMEKIAMRVGDDEQIIDYEWFNHQNSNEL